MGRVRTTLLRRAALGAVVMTSAFAFAGQIPRPDSAGAAIPTSRIGFYPGYASVTNLKSLDAWLGRNASYVVQFGDTRPTAFVPSVWGEVVKTGALQTMANQVTLVESVPLGFGAMINASTAAGQASARANLQATLNGTNDAAYRTAASYLKSGGFPNAIIRLGWEFDGDWMPWSSKGNEALWVAAYRHVHDLFAAISPSFRFDWNGDSSYLQNATAAYPGDGYVDIVGLDVYDKGMGGAVAWNSSTKTWSDPAAAWAGIQPNLAYQRDFAISHGKPVSYPEWALTGVNATVTSQVGGDDPTFVQGMSDWMNSLPASGPGSLAYESYFNEDTADGHHRIDTTYFPKAALRFQTVFGLGTTVSLGSSAPSTVMKQAVLFMATPSNPDGSPATGTVSFLNGSKLLALVTVKNGVALFTTRALPIGNSSIIAKYHASATSLGIASAPVLHHVDPASTTTRLGVPAATYLVSGKPITLSATVAPVSPGYGIPTGTVTFTNLSTHVAARFALVSGKAHYTIASLPAGGHSFSVQYSGSSGYSPSVSTSAMTVAAAKT